MIRLNMEQMDDHVVSVFPFLCCLRQCVSRWFGGLSCLAKLISKLPVNDQISIVIKHEQSHAVTVAGSVKI